MDLVGHHGNQAERPATQHQHGNNCKLDAREAANRIAKDTCSRAVVQFLDGTVAFAGFRLTRDTKGRRRLLRTYTFDYTSDGFERAQGFIVLAGLRLEAVGLAGSPS